ncbi:Major Facilitator Superfamily (MFS) [Phytophthora cinnamomi]|uniref:Major Facilitator Superfamily (MFS) n=1 Tax=Phytophthora cinnamomi TaxID=4785 RepID=UPI003559C48F|nr:Major Facilitator Superfamily (MFS) [Phytophthora cinnamomi]
MGFRLGFLFDGGEAKELIPLKLLYVIHYFAFSMQTYLPIYFDTTANFSKAQIGVLLSIPCICAIVSPPVWGAIADGIHNQKFAHTVCLVSAAFLFFSIQYVTSFPLMCAMVFVANFQTQPSFSLLDHAAMAWLERVGGDYGKQRLYGAAGYGAGGYFASVVASSLGIEWCFNMVLILSSVSLFLLLAYVPNIQHEAEHHQKGELVKSLKAILHQHDVLALFAIVILAGIMGGLIDNMLFLWLFNLSGNNAHIVGVVIAIETVSELPFFFNANKIIERFGTPKCVFVSLIAYGIRMITYILVQHPWLVLPIEVLHGLTYGLLLAAFTNYIYEAAPKGTEGTMIGVLFAVQRGIGGGLSTLVGGWIYGALGGRMMWGIAGFIVFPLSMAVTAGFACLARSYAAQSPTSSKANSGSITSDESSLLDTSADYGTTDASAQC